MKTTITYTGPGSEKLTRAINDTREYLGEDHFNKIVKHIREVRVNNKQPMTVEQLGFLLSFAGVQGYPIHAMYWYIYGHTTDMVYLDSVGSFFDTRTRIVYPCNSDNTPDYSTPCHEDHIESDDWFDGLSDDDKETLKKHSFKLP